MRDGGCESVLPFEAPSPCATRNPSAPLSGNTVFMRCCTVSAVLRARSASARESIWVLGQSGSTRQWMSESEALCGHGCPSCSAERMVAIQKSSRFEEVVQGRLEVEAQPNTYSHSHNTHTHTHNSHTTRSERIKIHLDGDAANEWQLTCKIPSLRTSQ